MARANLYPGYGITISYPSQPRHHPITPAPRVRLVFFSVAAFLVGFAAPGGFPPMSHVRTIGSVAYPFSPDVMDVPRCERRMMEVTCWFGGVIGQ